MQIWIREHLPAMVLGGIFIILLALVRRPGPAVYLLATMLLSYYATLGATTLFAHFYHTRPLGLSRDRPRRGA
ncbi:MAG TPA: hypothetical protein VGV06_09260 [Methylomirabilota bacterium]|nr:hypothetical protein [Methylomirabilota bacterium]